MSWRHLGPVGSWQFFCATLYSVLVYDDRNRSGIGDVAVFQVLPAFGQIRSLGGIPALVGTQIAQLEFQ